MLEEGIGSTEQEGTALKEPQSEEQGEGSWEITERILVTEERLDSSFEEIEGAKGVSTPEPAAAVGNHPVLTNENEEEPLSKEGTKTKKTFTLIP